MNSIRPPQFFHDLYRDLRDRRLFFPAIALLLCLVAVPVLLGGGTGPAAVPLPVVVDPDEAVAVQSAVLVEESGIRNYRQRLEALAEKNPFEQKFALPDAGGTDATTAAATDTSGSSAADASTPSSISSPSSSPPPTGADSSSPAPSVSPSTSAVGGDTPIDPSTDPTGSSTDPTGEPAPEIRFYAGRVDVSIGPVGDRKVIEDIGYLNFLPNDKAPVVAFLGLVGGGGERAVFSISSDVSEIKGDEGSCAPKKPAPCQFLTLKVGEERVLSYGPDAEAYRLKLLDTRVVRIPDPREE